MMMKSRKDYLHTMRIFCSRVIKHPGAHSKRIKEKDLIGYKMQWKYSVSFDLLKVIVNYDTEYDKLRRII